MTNIRHFSLAALLASSPVFAEDNDLLKMVSVHSDLAIHITNTAQTKAHWKQSPLKEIYESDQIKPQVDEIIQELLANDDTEDKESWEKFKKGMVALYDQVEGEVLISFEIPKMTEDDLEAINGDEVEKQVKMMSEKIGAILLAEVKDTEKFRTTAKEVLDILKKQAGGKDSEAEFKSKKIDGIEVVSLHVDLAGKSENLASFATVDQTAFLIFGSHEASDIITQIKKGHSNPLSKSQFISDGSSDFQVLGDLKDFWGNVKLAMNAFLEESGQKVEFQIDMEAGWRALALEGIRRFGFAMDMSQRDLVFRTKMEFPEKGFMSSLLPKEPVAAPSIHAHKNILSVTQANYDLPGIYDELMKTMKAISPMAPAMVQMGLGQMEQLLGVKLREDLLASFAPKMEYMFFKRPTPQEVDASLCVIIGLKDKDKFESTFKTIVGGMGLQSEKEEFLGYTINNVPMPMLGGEVLSYAIVGNDLIMGLDSGGGVKDTLKQIKNPQETLWKSKLFDKHRDLLKPDPINLSLSDMGTMIRDSFDVFNSFMLDGDEGIDVSKIKIPFKYSLTAGWFKDGLYEGQSVILAE